MRKSKNRFSRRNQRKSGGNYDYTNFVYGNANQQQPIANGNTIALQNNPQNFNRGGGRQRQSNNRGGTILTDIAVPGVLLYANNMLGSRSRYGVSNKKTNFTNKKKSFYNKRFSRRRRRSK